MITLLSYNDTEGVYKKPKMFKAEMETGETVAIFDVDSNAKSGRDFSFVAQAVTSGFAPRTLASSQYVLTGDNEGKLFVHATYSAGDVVTVIGSLVNLAE